MALFGDGSFLAQPETYIAGDNTTSPHSCLNLTPMGMLFDETNIDYDYCIRNQGSGEDDSQLDLATYVSNFNGDISTLSHAFTAAAFLANQAWIARIGNEGLDRSLTISYDMGANATVPSISKGGIIAVSVVMGLFFFFLLSLAVYSMCPRWTNGLDAFTMVRIGAAIKDEVPLLVGRNTNEIKELDNLPGWVGDAADDQQNIGQLGLGAPARIDSAKRYACYVGDRVSLKPYELSKMKAAG